ncbi:MAG: Rrf2 family transcriptional regulator [Hyphomicrobium sp.]|jgi:Rrf2 family nitric oxide-sensitive transcriptional repressor
MRLSKTTNYAIRILLDCAAADGNLVKVAEISGRRDVTLQNTFKIVHLLSRAGFLQAMRGRHGGVRLARPAKEIRIGDVVRAIETMRLEVDDESGAAVETGVLDQLFDTALDAFISVLDGHTLHDMAEAQRARSPQKARRKEPAPPQKPAARSSRGSRRVTPHAG